MDTETHLGFKDPLLKTMCASWKVLLFSETRKNKEKLAYAFIEEMDFEDSYEDNDELVRTKTVTADTMELDEAIMRMEMLGHSFFIYRDNETNEIAVVYKRHDGGYGLLETE